MDKKNAGERHREESVCIGEKPAPFSTADGILRCKNAVPRIKTISAEDLEERAATRRAIRTRDIVAATSSCSPMHPEHAVETKGHNDSRVVRISGNQNIRKHGADLRRYRRATTISSRNRFRANLRVWPLLCEGNCEIPTPPWKKARCDVSPIARLTSHVGEVHTY